MRGRILIIEDEVDLARFMGYRLATADFEFLTAVNGKQGLQILNENEVDLVIMDVVMPEMDGYALCKTIRASENLSHLPIIVSTAYPEREREFRALGIDEFLIKPTEPQKLIDIVDHVLGKRPFKKKHKVILFDKDVDPEIKMAVNQIKSMGIKVDIEFLKDPDDLIPEVLRRPPDIFIMDAFSSQTTAHEIIRQLRGFVILRDMIVLVYSDGALGQKVKKRRREKKQKDSIIKQCMEAGATKYIDPWDKETLLSVLLGYCRI